MKKSRFAEENMVAILREADRSSVAEVARKHKVSEQTIYTWRQKFGALEPVDVKRLRALEGENARLKRMLAERDMAIDTLSEADQPQSVVSSWVLRSGCLRHEVRATAAAPASRPRPLFAYAPNSVWAYDLIGDACANGQQFKCLTIVDEFTRSAST